MARRILIMIALLAILCGWNYLYNAQSLTADSTDISDSQISSNYSDGGTQILMDDAPGEVYIPSMLEDMLAKNRIFMAQSEASHPDFYGTWEVVGFYPNRLIIMGVLTSLRHINMARDALDLEIEFQPDYYRFDELVFSDIEYRIVDMMLFDITESLYEDDGLLFLLNQINQIEGKDEEVLTADDYFSDGLYVVWVKGDIWPDEYDEKRMLAETTAEFVIINDNYIFHASSGLLSVRKPPSE